MARKKATRKTKDDLGPKAAALSAVLKLSGVPAATPAKVKQAMIDLDVTEKDVAALVTNQALRKAIPTTRAVRGGGTRTAIEGFLAKHMSGFRKNDANVGIVLTYLADRLHPYKKDFTPKEREKGRDAEVASWWNRFGSK